MSALRIWLSAAVLTAFVCREASAIDQQALTEADVSCVVVCIRASSDSNATRQLAGMMTALYYLGRLDGRSSQANIDQQISVKIKSMTDLEFRSEAIRCGDALNSKGKWVQQIGSSLTQGADPATKSSPAYPKQ